MKKIVTLLCLTMLISLSTFAYVDFEKTISEADYWGWGNHAVNGTLWATPDGEFNYGLTCTNDGGDSRSIAAVWMDFGYLISIEQNGDGEKTKSGYMNNNDSAIQFYLYVEKGIWGMNSNVYATVELWGEE